MLTIREVLIDRKVAEEILQGHKMVIEKVGMIGPEGLAYVSDCVNVVVAEVDGPVLWDSIEDAKSVYEAVGGFPVDHEFRRVTIIVHDGDTTDKKGEGYEGPKRDSAASRV
jgi:hypothetical protein